MDFLKLHGQGNDFLLVAEADWKLRAPSPDKQSDLAREMCRPHYGAGADGLIVVAPAAVSDADFRMTLWNADGGRAEMSGNGLRCAAVFCRVKLGWTSDVVRVETDAGVKTARFECRSGLDFRLEAEIGPPRLAPEEIPVNLDHFPPLVNIPISTDEEEIRAVVTSMGNPHCSVFVETLDPKRVSVLGPKLERHPLFPARTNVEFVHVLNRDRLRVLFWERGAGPTLSSGTGSCAAVVAAILQGKTDRRVTVETEAGELSVEWPENGPVKLTGPVRVVYRGNWL